jgi:nicotinate-nucleotide adenylyltransferase
MDFVRRASGNPARLGVLSAAFNPPTRAHLGLARSSLLFVEEVVFVMPRSFPHKDYQGVGLEDRLAMVAAATASEPRFSVAVTEGGLFIEIARECRTAYGREAEIWFLCGRDAAERIVNWQYGQPHAFEKQLEEFGLLVADRDGRYDPPEQMRGKIINLALDDNYEGISASDVRAASRAGREWKHLVADGIEDLVERLYSP